MIKRTDDVILAGFLAAFLVGFLISIPAFFATIFLKEKVIMELELAKETYGELIPYSVDTLYIIILLTIVPSLTLIYTVGGVFFAAIFDRFKKKSFKKVVILSLGFGLIFGLIINLPSMSRVEIIILNIIAWFLFSLVFSWLYSNANSNKIKEKLQEDVKNEKAILYFLNFLAIFTLSLVFIARLLEIKVMDFVIIYMYLPMFSAILARYLCKESIFDGISIKLNKWLGFALIFPVFMTFSTLAVSLLFPNIEYSAKMENLAIYGLSPREADINAIDIGCIMLIGLVAGSTINAIVAFGEEYAWRGFLFDKFKRYGFWKASWLIGLIWGIWHIPVISEGWNYPQHPLIGMVFMIVFCLLISPLLVFIRVKAGLISAAITHGIINATAWISVAFTKGGSDLIIGITGISGFIVLIVTNLGLCFYQKIKKIIA